MSATKDRTSYLETLEAIATSVIRPAAAEIDQSGSFPRARRRCPKPGWAAWPDQRR